MNETTTTELIKLTNQLLESVAKGDWRTYASLCDPTLTAFEPEARGHLVSGMAFHQFYFEQLPKRTDVNTTISSPDVRLVGNDVAIVSYVRLTQKMSGDGSAVTNRCEETRVWQQQEGRWKHIHFHRSENQ